MRLREALTRQGKIMAIKLCRELHPGMGLAEAKQKVERLESSVPQATPSPTVTSTGCLSVLMALILVAGYCVQAYFAAP